jgi:hypothetical protein
LSDLLQVVVPDLLARANQLEQEAPTIFVPENDSEPTETSPYKAGEISPMPKTITDQYSPEILRQKTNNLPFKLNLIDLPINQDSQTVMSADNDS